MEAIADVEIMSKLSLGEKKQRGEGFQLMRRVSALIIIGHTSIKISRTFVFVELSPGTLSPSELQPPCPDALPGTSEICTQPLHTLHLGVGSLSHPPCQ